MAETRATGEAAGSNIRCPECKSTNVSCTDGWRAHVHKCHDCGYSTVARSTKR